MQNQTAAAPAVNPERAAAHRKLLRRPRELAHHLLERYRQAITDEVAIWRAHDGNRRVTAAETVRALLLSHADLDRFRNTPTTHIADYSFGGSPESTLIGPEAPEYDALNQRISPGPTRTGWLSSGSEPRSCEVAPKR